MLKYALLGFLTYSPMTGYELKQRMDRSTAHFWHAKQSQIYTTLKAMEKDGFIVSAVQTQNERPDRRVYTITKTGIDDFHVWLNTPFVEISPKKETFVLKMFFAAHMDQAAQLAQLRLQLDLHHKQLAFYRSAVAQDVQRAAEEFPQFAKDAQMWEATRRFGERYEEIYVEWIEDLAALLSNETPSR